MAIAPKQPINAALAKVDSSAPLRAELASAPVRVAARLEKSARKLKVANEAMAEYKQKKEAKKLKNQTVSYIQKLFEKEDDATKQVLQSLSINPEDRQEVSQFIDVMGGSKNTMDTILQSIEDTQKLFREAEDQRRISTQLQSALTGGQPTSADGTAALTMPDNLSSKGKTVVTLLEAGMPPEDVKEYLNLLDFEDPVTGKTADLGKEVMEDFANMQKDIDANGPYIINFENGTVKYKGKGFSNQDINPGDAEYENLRKKYPDGVAELDRRRAFRAAQGAPADTGTGTPIMSEEERRRLSEKYNINL